MTVKGVSVNGTSYAFGGLAFPLTIAPGQSVTFSGTFAPSAVGTVSGSFDFTLKPAMNQKGSRGAFKTSVGLSGTGTTAATGQLSANPSSLTFGTVALGGSSSQYQTVTNSGSAECQHFAGGGVIGCVQRDRVKSTANSRAWTELDFQRCIHAANEWNHEWKSDPDFKCHEFDLGIALSGSASSAGHL